MTNVNTISARTIRKQEFEAATSMWQQFNQEIPTEIDALEDLFKIIYGSDTFSCRHCGSTDIERIRGARTLFCLSCKDETLITSGTFFHRMKQAKPWLFAIRLMEHGITLNAFQFHRLVGTATSSTQSMLQNIRVVLVENMDESTPTVNSSSCSSVICKRSRETPKKVHPRVEQEEIDQKLEEEMVAHKLRDVEASADLELSGEEKQIYELLTNNPIHIEALCEQTGIAFSKIAATLTLLEFSGAVKCKNGLMFSCNVPKPDPMIATLNKDREKSSLDLTKTIAEFTIFIKMKFHGISRKYLQLYLAEFWCQKDRKRWYSGKLMEACLELGYVSKDWILNYVSAPTVKVLPAK